MRIFNLDREGKFNYTISRNGKEFASERFYNESQAIEWANSWISSFSSSSLKIMFKEKPTIGEFYEQK